MSAERDVEPCVVCAMPTTKRWVSFVDNREIPVCQQPECLEAYERDAPLQRRVHELKCWPGPFQAMVEGRKRHEFRRNDRGFIVGDTLCLREWDNFAENYTGRTLAANVTYKTCAGQFGIPPGYVVMSLAIPPPDAPQPSKAEERNAVLEEAARVCDAIHDDYRAESLHTLAVERAASTIRALKTQSGVPEGGARSKLVECSACGGAGRIAELGQYGTTFSRCRDCDGTGSRHPAQPHGSAGPLTNTRRRRCLAILGSATDAARSMPRSRPLMSASARTNAEPRQKRRAIGFAVNSATS